MNLKIHPCRCTDYNGGQCYNCLNGFHKGCEKRCKTPNAKILGLRIKVLGRSNERPPVAVASRQRLHAKATPRRGHNLLGNGIIGRRVKADGFKGVFIVTDVIKSFSGLLYFLKRKIRDGGNVHTALFRNRIKFIVKS